ncbi:MAG: DUF4325 domain-containing protein [bacterium]
MHNKSEKIQQFIIENVENHPRDIAFLAATKFQVTRQAINKHVRNLINKNILTETGSTRAKSYLLFSHILISKMYPIEEKLAEDRVYALDILPNLKILKLSKNVEGRCHYCFTEIFNNAIDHSEGTVISLLLSYDERYIKIVIDDNGVGIFKKIMHRFNLEDERVAILELSKGKLTTAPKMHSGEGIFFSSRISDRFMISSHHLDFLGGESFDTQFEKIDETVGTQVFMKILRNSERTAKEVFDTFASEDDADYGFTVTHIPVELAKIGEENLVSRSQAKRLLARLDKFREVALDFTGVSVIGQSFADEIFRVFRNEHPNIHIWHFNANAEVTQMIKRAEFARSQSTE